jgi:hypothetical protein
MPIFIKKIVALQITLFEIEKEFGDERTVEKVITLHLSLVYDLFLME